MAKSNPTKNVELHSDAWERFERASGVVAKTPPQHRKKPLKSMRPKGVKAQSVKRKKVKA
jgi:hypothetical protein